MKLRKGFVMIAAAFCVAMFASAAMAVDVATKEELAAAIANGGEINVTQDIPDAGLFQIEKDTSINLNGYTVTRDYSGASTGATPIFYVTKGKLILSNGSLISKNSVGSAEGIRVDSGVNKTSASAEINSVNITADYFAVSMRGNCDPGNLEDKPSYVASVIVNGDSVFYGEQTGVIMQGKQTELTVNSGEIKSPAFAISGNGTRNANANYGGTIITINGGSIISEKTCAIYQPQAGTITITGGTVTGYDGIQMKSGTLNMTGGTLEGTGAFDDDYTYEEGQHDGSLATGAALAILSEGAVGETGYAGEITINISGDAVLKSTYGYAIAEAFSNSSSESKFAGLNISGGSFIGASNKNAVAMTNAKEDNITITGGTFSSDLSQCDGLSGLTNLPTMTKDENGNFVAVTTPAETLEIVSDALEVGVGSTLQLRAEMTPEGANDKVVWSSSDEAVATVDQNGLVTGVSVGTVTITGTITHTDAALDNLEATIELTVIPEATPDPTPSDSGSGGGCSAGFGALALLAAVPLLRMRKK